MRTRNEQERRDDFARLLQEHGSQVFGYVYALLHNLHDAEDVYQNTCGVLWSKFDRYRPGTQFVSWACEIARREVLRCQRSRRRRRAVFSVDLQIELASLQERVGHETSQERRLAALAGCIEKLSPADRELLQQCYSTGENFKQIALRLERTPKSIYNTLGRIRTALLNCVKLQLSRQESI